jgi:phosphoserine phosphatase
MDSSEKKYVATDLEGTLTAAEGWKSIRHYFEVHGRRADFLRFFITQLPRLALNRLGWLDTPGMRQRWMEDQARLFKGYTPSELAEIGAWVVEHEFWPKRREAVVAEVMRHQASGGHVILVSALYQPLLDVFARRLAHERVEAIGTPLEFRNGRATGRCAGPICAGEVKAQRVKEHIRAGMLEAAYGDTGPDAPMLKLSRRPVAVYPDNALRRIAHEHGWRVEGALS